MSFRPVQGQGSLADGFTHSRLGGNERLDRIVALIDWRRVERRLAPVRPGRTGAPPYPALMMFKALLLQQWYGLSDPGLEEALNDRLSFRRFLGLGSDVAAPDHATLWRFREALGRTGVDRRAFAAVNAMLDAKGLVVRQGTLIDASLIAAQSNPPPAPPAAALPEGASRLVGTPREPDADWTRRGRQRHFGYKAHVAVDQGSALIRDAKLTPASWNDTRMADGLVQGDERAVYADMAYHTHARCAGLRECGIKPRIMLRPNKHHPLTPRQRHRNALIRQVRGRVETTFAILKRHYDHRRARYLTLARNATRLLLACTAINLRRAVVLTR